jgi:predicted amidophosphoribosyltransferase
MTKFICNVCEKELDVVNVTCGECVEKAEKAETRLRELYPRVFKLMDKGKYFVVVAFDEPYFLKVYSMIRDQEKKIGRWNEEDEKVYQFFQQEDE